MKYFLPNTLTFVASNVADDEDELGNTYEPFVLANGVNVDHIQKYGENIYKSLTTIYPLVQYLWEDAITIDIHVHDLHNQVDIYPTGTPATLLIPIVSGVTTFYVRSLNKWYIAKATGTFDLLLEDKLTPAHFNQIVTSPIPYRNVEALPIGETDTIYWGYEGKANKFRCLDKAIGTQTSKVGNGSLTMSFSCNGCNAISLFNVFATTVDITVWDRAVPAFPIQIYTTSINMLDTSALDTYEKVCTIPVPLGDVTSAFFQTRYAQQIDLVFSGVSNPAVGAIKVGLLDFLGVTLDGVDIGIKSYNITEQRPNGEIVWNKDNKETNKVNILRYNIRIDTSIFDSAAKRLKSITDKEVVLLGDDGDPDGYGTLLSYGAIKSTSTTLRSNDTKSTASIEIENFV